MERGILSAFATREGGCSEGEFAGLNTSASVGDAPEAVSANRRLLTAALGISELPLLTVRQEHGARVIHADVVYAEAEHRDVAVSAGPAVLSPHLGPADVIVSTSPGIALMIGTADCLPLLLCDPEARTVAAVHVGWRGLLAGVVEAASSAVRSVAGARDARDIRALTGSCICSDCYVVGEDLHATFARLVPRAAARNRRGAPTLDLRAAVHAKLAACGVQQVVATERECTYENPARWYSRRRDGKTGIQATVVALLC
ncbi:MAG TPA: polyphenol oxidase family protein [Actinocrinis sp.]|uniref:polyphenol oxidase family protein n=1 Tax=Actinocrinis sp. TaxID=1920516 RepID=UPI002DDCF6EB|nr:polyphenol oxidase family protein [Actinocrinis sp.]HEV2342684.1 polyphenol oxidase family protein [Actinocrinis sp.]